MKYFQVIITFPDENAPKVYLIPEHDINLQTRERMEKEIGDFPFWCSPCCEDSICDIDEFGIRMRVDGESVVIQDCDITRTFWYTVG